MVIDPLHFIVVDDDPVNNMICKKVIAHAIPLADIKTFTEPENGLAYLKTAFAESSANKSVLFLDINMPSMTGWEFLEQFELARMQNKERLSIYILSSSVNTADKEKAKANHNITGYLVKPLSVDIMRSLA